MEPRFAEGSYDSRPSARPFRSEMEALVVALEHSKSRLYKGHQNIFDQMHIFL